MYIIKRDGRRQEVQLDKITARIKNLVSGLNPKYIDPVPITLKVAQGIYSGVSTSELDVLAAQTAAYCSTQHPDFSKLAARISVSNLHKNTPDSFSKAIRLFYEYIHPKTGQRASLIADDVYNIVMENAKQLDATIDSSRDFNFDYFGFKTLEKSYLLKVHGKVMERPQYLFMRVAIGIHKSDIAAAIETYDCMSRGLFIHATPTLFNSGTPRPQLSSCFLMQVKEDSIEGIYDTLKWCACISKYAGGIGIAIHDVRARDSYIRGSNGTSNGIVPMLRVFDGTARYVDQGGGKRKGSFAIYLEPWHADIFDFLELRKNHGNELERARDLFYALWIPDLFMQRVEEEGNWSLFCPNEAPGLSDVYGAKFKELFEKYEREGKAKRTVPARELWFTILTSQVETGGPFILFKDKCNEKSNQMNLGTIKSSNLCTEIIEYTSKDEVAVCNLASINLGAFVNKDGSYDFQELYKITKIVTRNLNRVIDVNYYPIPEAQNSNRRHRPIGIGVQGLADTYIKMRFPYDSENAHQLNRDIFETIYFGAVEASMELAIKDGTYESFQGSPISKGIFQFDMWRVQPSNRWNWDSLRENVIQNGVRNSLLIAPMPTASTAQILGNNESTEPFTSNLYSRRVLAGDFVVVNKYLLNDLIERNLWTRGVRNQIMADRGSIQNVSSIPKELKDLYKTVWEIPQKVIIDQAADRGAFICQNQSMNIHLSNPTSAQLTSLHFYAWKKGLKSSMYYLRTLPKADAIQFTVDQTQLEQRRCRANSNDGACEMCSA